MIVNSIGLVDRVSAGRKNSVAFSGDKGKYSTTHFDERRASSDVKKALDVMDKKLEVIIHGPSAPSKSGKDVGVGMSFGTRALRRARGVPRPPAV